MTVIIVLFGMLITNANTYSLLQLPVMHAYIWICEKIFILMLCLKYQFNLKFGFHYFQYYRMELLFVEKV